MAPGRDCNGGPGNGASCIPGCSPVGRQCLSAGCTCWDCSFPPEHLADALTTQIDTGVTRHNEVVLDTRWILASLPRCVLAFFTLGPDADELRATRAAFLREYALPADASPLLNLDLHAAQPFRSL
jgi:hypothetical protein